MPIRAGLPLPCCNRTIDECEPGLVTVDPDAVTCGRSWRDFAEHFDRAIVRLDAGQLDIGLVPPRRRFIRSIESPMRRILQHLRRDDS